MRNKFLTLFVILICLHFSSQAQKGSNYLSLGPSIGIPLNFSSSYKTGVGAGIRGYFGIGRQGFLLGNVNYLSFPYKFRNTYLAFTSAKFGVGTFLNSSNVFLYGDGGLVIRGRTGSSVGPGLGVGLGFAIPVPNGGYVD